MKNKWWTLFYYTFFHFLWSFVQGTPEKLTQEQVLEELGVKIETKGKKSQQQNCFRLAKSILAWNPKGRICVFDNFRINDYAFKGQL